MNLEKHKYTKQLTELECLHNYVKYVGVTVLTACEMTSENIGCLSIRPEGFGLYVSQEVMPDLKVGDRVMELNAKDVFKIVSEDWDSLKSELRFPCEAVFMHSKIRGKESYKEDNGLKEEISMIQSRLEQKLCEGRNVSTELEKVQKEKTAIFQENTRLNHRIAYLEEHTQDLQYGLKQVHLDFCYCLRFSDQGH